MYSWRLIMAPPEILNYVAAHEVAHLVEMNHSDAFWSVVRDIYPDYATARMWLRKRGAELHRYDFEA
jgi:predicted metal-dependent hydrolase